MLNTIVGILGGVSIAVVGWVLQIGNRVTVLETREVGLRELLDTRFDAIEERLKRIERHVLNGHAQDEG